MKKESVFVLLFSILSPTSAFSLDETSEPLQAHSLEIDGQVHSIELGRPLVLSGSFTNPTVKLIAASTRHFEKAGVEFNYPASFTWEADVEDREAKSWTLSGNDFKIMVFSLGTRMTADSYSKLLATKFGVENTKVSPVERKLGKNTYEGRLLRTTLVGTAISQEVFEFTSESASRLIVFSDTLPDGKNASSEAQDALHMVTQSFKIQE